MTAPSGTPTTCEVACPRLQSVIIAMAVTLNAVVVSIGVFVIVRAVIDRPATAGWVTVGVCVLFVGFAVGVGAVHTNAGRRTAVKVVWLTALAAVWGALMLASSEAAFLALPMFLLYLWILPGSQALPLMVTARETAAESLVETRHIIADLSPAPLAEQGMVRALHRLAETQWSRPGLRIDIAAADPGLSMRAQAALLRIAQGVMANVLQHANASRAWISLTEDGSHVRLTVADDGRGFTPARHWTGHPRGGDSFGLTAARDRASQLGGTLTVESVRGQGTVVVVEVEAEAA